jgi:hypothetical protein
MMMVVVMVVNYHHDLRLRRIRYSEAADKSQFEQRVFHAASVARFTKQHSSILDLRANLFYRHKRFRPGLMAPA